MTRISILLISVLFISSTACGGKKAGNIQEVQQPANSEESTAMPERVIPVERVFEAALNGELPYIQQALEKGFDANTTDPEKHTALMLAAYNGHSELVSLLLKHGADPDILDLNDRTALMYASTGPFPETVSLLLDAGASLNLIDKEEHFTALMFAAAEGQSEIVRMLLDHGADKSLRDIDGESAYDFALNNGHEEAVKMLK